MLSSSDKKGRFPHRGPLQSPGFRGPCLYQSAPSYSSPLTHNFSLFVTLSDCGLMAFQFHHHHLTVYPHGPSKHLKTTCLTSHQVPTSAAPSCWASSWPPVPTGALGVDACPGQKCKDRWSDTGLAYGAALSSEACGSPTMPSQYVVLLMSELSPQASLCRGVFKQRNQKDFQLACLLMRINEQAN